MIVVVYTKDGYWLAADSYRSRGGKHIEDVCKVHETRFGLLAKGGDSQGETETGELYSTDKEVEDLLSSSDNLEDFKTKVRVQFKQDIEQELVFLIDDPTVTSRNLDRFRMDLPIPDSLKPVLLRSLVIFDTKTSDRTGKILLVVPQSSPEIDSYGKRSYKYWAPSIAGWHDANDFFLQPVPPAPSIVYPHSVNEFSYLVSYDKTDSWVQKHPRKAITEILNKAHIETPENIGPPYSIVHVIMKKFGPPKIKWVSKGVCPKWTESISTENSLVKLRDEQRAQKAQ